MGRHLVTDQEYDEMLNRQGGVCAICLTPPPTLRNLAVDHDHDTGAVRGLLCSRCNLGLGYFKDNPARLMAAYRYLMGGFGDPGDSLVGNWFLSFKERDDLGGEIGLEWQGQITGRTADSQYVVQLYSWWDGAPTMKQIVPFTDVADWEFFGTDEEMRERSDNHHWPRQEQIQRRLERRSA